MNALRKIFARRSTHSWDFKPKGNEERKWVKVSIGDKVIDMGYDMGGYMDVFTVEEIRWVDGWVWGSDMQQPYYNGSKKNFVDNHIAWKL